jgi:hypothetical protein
MRKRMPRTMGKEIAAYFDPTPIRAIWAMHRNNVAMVLMAAIGRSMSMSCKSWLNLLRIEPLSVVEKNNIGALRTVVNSLR